MYEVKQPILFKHFYIISVSILTYGEVHFVYVNAMPVNDSGLIWQRQCVTRNNKDENNAFNVHGHTIITVT